MTETTQVDVEQLLSDYVDVLNGDFSKLDVLSESYCYYGPDIPEEGVQGRAAYRDLLQTYLDAFPDLEHSIDEMIVSDDIVMIEWIATGTHEGELDGIPPTGRSFEAKSMDKLVIEDGKIQEEWSYYDPSELMEQLGIEAE